jgi:3-dehydroquinate synthase
VKIVDIKGGTGLSTIRVGENLENLREYVPEGKAVIITDSNVSLYYKQKFPPYDIIEIGTGEEIKNLDTVNMIYGRLVDLEADRSTFIIGIGGGIVCDISGLVASTYMRGVRFGFVSTTLLSQVDASVGGKNGVNYRGYKNIVGVFNQPEFVLCDTDLLKTLPQKEVLCGLAEIVKHGAIADGKLFSYIEDNHKKILSLERTAIERLVYDSVVIKSSIVNRDEREQGERKKLNFGHTFGHALEKAAGVSHGFAVSVGMLVASRLSTARGSLSMEDGKRLERLLEKLKLPIRLNFDREKVLDAIRKDKKRRGQDIDFILLREIGKAVVEKIPIKELEEVVRGI